MADEMTLNELEDEAAEPEKDDPSLDAEPGEDVPVAAWDSLTVIQAIKACWEESDIAFGDREPVNRINQDAYASRQDFSDKARGQSTDFLPKTALAVEQLAALFKQAMVSFGDYFDVTLTPDPDLVDPDGTRGLLSASSIVKLMRHRLEDPSQLVAGQSDFPTLIEDGVKVASLEANLILKVHGAHFPTRRLSVDLVDMPEAYMDEEGEEQTRMVPTEALTFEEGKVWRVLVDLVKPSDYRPDPTGRGLYEIHRTYKDLYEVIDLAESGEYDAEAVALLAGSYTDYEVDRDHERRTQQPYATPPDFRKQVEIREFWGSIPDSDGNMAHRNVRCAIANEKFLIRRPEPNPNWHQESPFVAGALLRVPFSVFHKGIFDVAVRLNLAINSLFNLITDGGIGSVWGVRQVHMDLIENPEDFTDGIPMGATIFAKAEAPPGVDLVKQVTTAKVPPESMQVLALLERQFDAASMLPQTKMGQIPKKEVRATEVHAAEQSSDTFLDSMVSTLERTVITRALRLVWLTMLQNADDWNSEDVVGCIGPTQAKALADMSPARRYKTYAQGARFKVSGLSDMLSRSREFQKLMAGVAAITQSPILMQPFMATCSPAKLLNSVLKGLNIDPETFKMTEEERLALPDTMNQMAQLAQMARGAQGDQQAQTDPSQQAGNPTQQVQAQVAQQNQPPQGLI